MKNNIISKFICFIKNFFNKTKLLEEHHEEPQEKNDHLDKIKFSKQLKVDDAGYEEMRKEKAMNEIINRITNDPELLNDLSISKLEKINGYFDQKLEEVNSKINNLKKAI